MAVCLIWGNDKRFSKNSWRGWGGGGLSATEQLEGVWRGGGCRLLSVEGKDALLDRIRCCAETKDKGRDFRFDGNSWDQRKWHHTSCTRARPDAFPPPCFLTRHAK